VFFGSGWFQGGASLPRRLHFAVLAASASLALAACTGGSDSHGGATSPPNGRPSTASSAPVRATSNSASSSSLTATPSTDTTSTAIETPTVVAPAQGAVNAYIALTQATVNADRDPQTANLKAIDSYLSGNARSLIIGAISAMAKAHQAYRGEPADPRVKVSSIVNASFVYLSSCPLVSTTDPYTEYDVDTGKAIPVAARTPSPPYLLTLPMKNIDGHWKLTDVLQNTSKTCSG
jgi:hypothetical protein